MADLTNIEIVALLAERDRLREALVDCERVMNVSANQLYTQVSSFELTAISKRLTDFVIKARNALAEGEK